MRSAMPSARTFILMLALFMVTSCATDQPVEITTVELVSLERIAGEGELTMRVHCSNPNKSSVNITKTDVTAYINQKKLGIWKNVKPIAVEGNSSAEIELDYSFKADDIYKGFLSNQFGAIGSKNVRIRLEGTVTTGEGDDRDEVPVAYSEIHEL